jgi:hypothetical protein
MGPKPSREAMPAFRRRKPTFCPSGTGRSDPRVYGTRRRSVQSPSHSLRSCPAPAGPLVASLKSVAAVLRFRSGDQRLIPRADTDNCFAAGLMAAAGVLFAGRSADAKGSRRLAPLLAAPPFRTTGNWCSVRPINIAVNDKQ